MVEQAAICCRCSMVKLVNNDVIEMLFWKTLEVVRAAERLN